MTQKEIEEAVKFIKMYISVYSKKEDADGIHIEMLNRLLSLVQLYLDLKGWPEEKRTTHEFCDAYKNHQHNPNLCQDEIDEDNRKLGFNEALHLCKLIYLKRENEIESKIKKAIESKLRFYVESECPSIGDFMEAIHSELT